MAPSYWLMKTEPGEFSYDDLERDGHTLWDGVRNYQAKNNMCAMAKGDLVLIYHSVTQKAVAGIAKVTKTAHQDPTDDTGKWVVVDLAPVKKLKEPVELATIKATASLAEIKLIKQSRLSVMPLEKKEFDTLVKMGGLEAVTA